MSHLRLARGCAAFGAALAVFHGTSSADAQALSPHAVATNMPGVYAFPQPPAGFDRTTATNTELEAWGFRPRPSPADGSDALAKWLRATDPKLRRVIPQLKVLPGVYHRPVADLKITARSADGKNAAATSSNWSGIVLTPGAGAKPYYLVEGAWSVPMVKQAPGTCSGGWDYSSEWVGIGGNTDSFLLQAGSSANAYCDVGGNVPEYVPWLEWLPAAETVLYQNAKTETLYPFQPGDFLVVEVWATGFSSANVSKTGNLLFEDISQGWSISLTFSAASIGGSEVTGKSAEWIVERTTIGKTVATLPDYIADPFVATAAYDLNKLEYLPGSPASSAVTNITMLDNAKKPESSAEIFGTNSIWFFPEGSATK